MKKRSALLIVAFLALVVAGRYLGRYLPGFAEWVNGFGPWGAAVFVATYPVACVALAPASLMTLAAGAVFGAAKGVLVAWVAAALGLSRVSLGGYLVAMLGIIPGTFLLVSSGAIAGDVAAVAGGVRLAHGWPYYAVLGLGIGATVFATLRITRVTRRVLAGT